MSVSYCDLFPLICCLIDIVYSAVHQIVHNYNDTLQFCVIVKHEENHFPYCAKQNYLVLYRTVDNFQCYRSKVVVVVGGGAGVTAWV